MAKGTNKTVVVDRGERRIRELIAEMQRAGGPHIKVGIFASAGMHEGGEGDMTVVDVATANEFGTSNIPERPFMRTSAKKMEPEMQALAQRLLAAMIEGKTTVDKALDIMGLKAVAIVKKTIRDWTQPPNSPATIRAKARKHGRERLDKAAKQGKAAEAALLDAYNNPLEDTDQMLNSVTYEKVK